MTERLPTRMEKHSVTIAGHKTSFTLEAAFWDALKAIAAKRGQSAAQLVAAVDRQRGSVPPETAPNLSSALRVFVLQQHLSPETVPVREVSRSGDPQDNGGQ
ncbi:MAG: ribbon-helix-helix domain-containing protein [Dongiaceae bacterium]